MSEEQEEIKLKRITIKTETGSKWFDEPEKLLAWVQQQRQLYAFHGQISQRYQMQQLFSTFENSWNKLLKLITNGLQRVKNDPDNYNTRVDQFIQEFDSFLKSKQLFTDEAPYYGFVQRQVSKSAEFGLAAIAGAMDVNVAQIDRKMYQGLREADAYFAGNEEQVNDEAESLRQLKQHWDEELTNHRDTWLLEYQSKTDEATRKNLKVDGLISDWQDQTETQTADLVTHKNQFKSQFDDELSDATTELKNLTKTYDDKLALHAAVKYWGIQWKSHNNKAIGFAIALGIATILVISTIILFSYSTLDAPLKEIHLSKIFTAAALTTFGIWLIKILANIFMSHLHLATDAQERRTMIHTYLALTRKGQGPKEEDRQLILQTLFRPSATDMMKNDQGPTQLVDMINRLSPKSN
jgi:hypothetical protein